MRPNDHAGGVTGGKNAQGRGGGSMPDALPGADLLDPLLRDWPDAQRQMAYHLVQRYGAPNEVTSDRLTWKACGFWACTILCRHGTPHNFPAPHSGFLLQCFAYKVPTERAGDVMRFSGSLLMDRTRGEVTARSNSEGANTIAINLMHDIVSDLRGIAEARNKFAEQFAEYMLGGEAPYARGLRFQSPENATADADEALIDDQLLRRLGAGKPGEPFTG